MAIKFLCDGHRRWLNHNPDQAILTCIEACKIGWNLFQEEKWEEALVYTGNAYEAAEIMLIHRVEIPSGPLEWYVNMVTSLTLSLKKLTYFDDCKNVYRAAIGRLKIEYMRSESTRPNLTRAIDRFQKELTELEIASRLPVKPQLRMVGAEAKVTVH